MLALPAWGGNGDGAAGARRPRLHGAFSVGFRFPGQQHNGADVAFAQGMIPHPRQAVEMAVADSRAEPAEVKQLVSGTEKAQDPKIKTLSGWLASWGERVPAERAMDHSMHGDSGGGMMTAEEMDKLKDSSDKAFDTAFMEMMIKRHEGAVAMAKTEKTDGASPTLGPWRTRSVPRRPPRSPQMNKLQQELNHTPRGRPPAGAGPRGARRTCTRARPPSQAAPGPGPVRFRPERGAGRPSCPSRLRPRRRPSGQAER
ncbi:DUF305 domain-containing protein [Streptomyces sp. NPDC059525]|uniref:DUF305 domain-containing protein n=1 Tax=Streptomyces sp. NPDC059525 TaxID=3346857 RepID=UPI0036C6F5B2